MNVRVERIRHAQRRKTIMRSIHGNDFIKSNYAVRFTSVRTKRSIDSHRSLTLKTEDDLIFERQI